MGQLLILPIMFVGMYFLLIRPQQKRVRAQQDLLRAVGDGDEVMTTSGMYGYVTAIEGDMVWLEIAEGVDIRISKSAIAKRVEASAVPDSADGSDHGAAAATDSAGAAETADTAEHPDTEGDR